MPHQVKVNALFVQLDLIVIKTLQILQFVKLEATVWQDSSNARHVLQVIFAKKEFHSHKNVQVDPIVRFHLTFAKHVRQGTIVLRVQ